MKGPESIQKRFTWKLIGNLLSHSIGALTLFIVPKALGVDGYGQVEFINRFSTSFLTFFIFSLPQGFFVWVAKKAEGQEEEASASLIVSSIYLSTILLFLLIIAVLLYFFKSDLLFPGIDLNFLILGLIFSMMTIFLNLLGYYSDGIGVVSVIEKVKVFTNSSKTGLFYALFSFQYLNITSFFTISIAATAGTIFISTLWLGKKGVFKTLNFGNVLRLLEKNSEFNQHIISYIKPFILTSILSFFYGIFEVWFLQYVGGNKEQAYFGLANKVILLAVVFFSSFTPIMAREFGHNFENNNKSKLNDLFWRSRYFYIFACFVSMGILIFSKELIQAVGGEGFRYGIYALISMSIYPMHQCLGQISGQLLLTCGEHSYYAKLSRVSIYFYIPFIYLLVGPEHFVIPGLGLGALGVSLVKVSTQIFTVNLQIKKCCSVLKTPFNEWMKFQLGVFGSFLILGVGVYLVKEVLSFGMLANALIAICLYVFIVAIILVYFPRLFQITKEELYEAGRMIGILEK